MPLPAGKINPYELVELVFSSLDLEDERVLVEPGLGLDASVVEFSDRVLVLSSDPITGALKDPGWLSVHVNANDIATMGASPEWFLTSLFLPEGSKHSDISSVMGRVRDACNDLDISLVGGHTEVTPGIGRVLISGTMIGEAPPDRWVSAGNAKPDDRILFTKSLAIEGTFILALDREEELKKQISPDLIERAKKFKKKLSVVEEALTAVKSGNIHAMHDPTEGGLIGGMYELADASKVGFSIKSEKIRILEETQKICEYFEIDPLRTISSGSLLICTPPEEAKKVLKSLNEKNIQANDIGEITQDKNVRRLDGEKVKLPDQDELWKIFKEG